ncbi:MAG: EAL domain-containing protein [Solirubrobacterales bacterium]|nr:EAL domain-containing protein [Solirubrobacterales bacterium]
MPQTADWRVAGRPASAKRRFGLLIAAEALALSLILLNLIEGTADFANGTWVTVLICLIPPLTAAACFARAAANPADQLAWRLIGAGIACWALGAIGRFLFYDGSSRPIPSWVDPLFLAMYPLVLLGLALVLRNRLRSYRHLALFDATAGFILLVALAFSFFPGQIKDFTGHDDLGTAVLAAYPLGDFGLLILTACLFRFSEDIREGPWLSFGAGLTLFAFADLAFAFASPGNGTMLSVLTAGYLTGFLLMINGSWRPDGEVIELRPGAIQLLPPVVYLSLAVIGLVYGQGHDLWDSAVVALTLTIALVLVRLALTAYEYTKEVRSRERFMLDDVTGLPTRNRLDEWLKILESAPAWRESPLYVLAIGIERVGQLEAALGPTVMDEALSTAATRIRRTAGGSGRLALIDRAEFGLVCSQESAPEPETLASAILRDFEPAMEINGIKLRLRPVIGVARSPEDTTSPRELLRLALISCDEARGRDEAVRLAPEDPERLRQELHRLEELREAVGSDEIRLCFQPKVRTSDGQVSAVEALVRWQHPQAGLLGPGEFVPLAEEHGLTPMLTDRVADLAAAQMREWADQGLMIDVAINLGMSDLLDQSISERIAAALDRHRVQASRLTLEVSENIVMTRPSLLNANLTRLKDDGFRISLDDFGSGTTALAHLRNLPLDEVKIDRSLIAKMHQSPQDAALAEGAISIAKELDLDVVAEGAEEESTVSHLTDIDCGEIQSFYFARPMPADQMADWLADHQPA